MSSPKEKKLTVRHRYRTPLQGLQALMLQTVRFRQFFGTHPFSALPLFLALFLLLTGCAEKYPRLDVIAPLPDSPNCRVAILPFAYQGDFPRGENILYKAFIAEMAAIPGFDVVAEGDVLQLYKQFRLFPQDQPNEEQLRILAQRLGAETLVLGNILSMVELDSGGEVSTELTLVLNLHEGESGKLLWNTYHKRRGDDYRNVLHYGRVNTMSGLARRMASEIITVWIENGMKQCAH